MHLLWIFHRMLLLSWDWKEREWCLCQHLLYLLSSIVQQLLHNHNHIHIFLNSFKNSHIAMDSDSEYLHVTSPSDLPETSTATNHVTRSSAKLASSKGSLEAASSAASPVANLASPEVGREASHVASPVTSPITLSTPNSELSNKDPPDLHTAVENSQTSITSNFPGQEASDPTASFNPLCRWTLKEDQLLLKEYKIGTPWNDIGEIYFSSRSKKSCKARVAHASFKKQFPHEDWEALKQARMNGVPWTPSEDRTLMEARRKGLLFPIIQNRYFPNRTAVACCRRAWKLKDGQWED